MGINESINRMEVRIESNDKRRNMTGNDVMMAW